MIHRRQIMVFVHLLRRFSWPLLRRRLLWILNHRTLLPAEIPILESLGFEVFVPSKTPDDTEFISATARHFGAATLPRKARQQFEQHAFYTDRWGDELISAINREFDAIITSVYEVPLGESLRHFAGPVIARVFGREGNFTYDELFSCGGIADLVKSAGDRFLFGQAYPNIEKIEPHYLSSRSSTIGCAIPASTWRRAGSWRRLDDEVLFLCPKIKANPYYAEIYNLIRSTFGELPHKIMGAQSEPVSDPNVLGFISEKDLFEKYARSAAFLYPSIEERHLHYSPLEAMVVGTPTLYMRGGMLSRLAQKTLPGECASLAEMKHKASILLTHDSEFAVEIARTQTVVLDRLRDGIVRKEWEIALRRVEILP